MRLTWTIWPNLFSGLVNIIVLPPYPQQSRFSHKLDLKHSANLRVQPGKVTSMAWTSDGYALAVGYENGWAVWSMGGRLDGWGVAGQDDDEPAADAFMNGASNLVSCSRLLSTDYPVLVTRQPRPVYDGKSRDGPYLRHALCQERYNGTAFTCEIIC